MTALLWHTLPYGHVEGWQAAGAARRIDFRELASGLSRSVYALRRGGTLRLYVDERNAIDIVRLLPIRVYDLRSAPTNRQKTWLCHVAKFRYATPVQREPLR